MPSRAGSKERKIHELLRIKAKASMLLGCDSIEFVDEAYITAVGEALSASYTVLTGVRMCFKDIGKDRESIPSSALMKLDMCCASVEELLMKLSGLAENMGDGEEEVVQ